MDTRSKPGRARGNGAIDRANDDDGCINRKCIQTRVCDASWIRGPGQRESGSARPDHHHKLHKVNRQFLERSAEDAGASRVEQAGMFIHSRCEVTKNAYGTRTQRAGDESIEYRNGDGGLVNDNFKVADAITTLVRVGELQRHGMTVGESTLKRKDSKSGNEAVRHDLEPKALNWYWLDEFEKVGGRLEGC